MKLITRFLLGFAISFVALASGEDPRTIVSSSLDENEVRLVAPREKLTVLFFAGVDCGFTNDYVFRINKFAKEFQSKADFFVVYSDSSEGEGEHSFAGHAKHFGFPALRDLHQRLAHSFNVESQGTVVLLDRDLNLVYTGPYDDDRDDRDDKNIGGKKEELRERVLGTLKGERILDPVRFVKGSCPIEYDIQTQKVDAGAVTYVKHVAPILHTHCVQCHGKSDYIFSLRSYDEAKRRGRSIVRAINRTRKLSDGTVEAHRQMPPWKAVNPGFLYTNVLSDKEKSTLDQWVKNGMPRGEGPEPKFFDFPSLTALQKKTNGPADVVLAPPAPYRLKDVIDDYRAFVIDPKFTEDKYVKMLTFVPGNKKVVHHITTFLLTTDEEKAKALRLDAEDPEVGFQSDGTGLGFTGGIGAWAPGGEPLGSWPGQGRLIPKGALFVMEVHYNQKFGEEAESNAGTFDQSKVELNFYKAPEKEVTEVLNTYLLRTEDLKIPPGVSGYQAKAEITLPFDVTIYGLGPHMHKVGHRFEAWASMPNGKKKLLVKIDDWDFNWQGAFFKDAKNITDVPAGSKLEITCTYDNTEFNEDAPRPIREIPWGPGTDAEMCEMYIGYGLTYVPKIARSMEHPLTQDERSLMEKNKTDPKFKKRSAVY